MKKITKKKKFMNSIKITKYIYTYINILIEIILKDLDIMILIVKELQN